MKPRDRASFGSEAIADYEQAILADPEVLSNYWHLGLLYFRQGHDDAAQSTWLSGLLNADPAIVEAETAALRHLLLAESEQLLQMGRPDRAELLCQQVLELDAELAAGLDAELTAELGEASAAVFFYLGQAVLGQGRLEEAVAVWQQAIDRSPEWAELYRQQGQVLRKLEHYEAAIAALQQAVKLQPDWQTHYSLGVCLGQLQQWQAAIDQLQQASQLHRNSAITADLGWAWLWLKQPQLAVEHFRVAVQAQSKFAQTYRDWIARLEPSGKADADQILNAQVLAVICDPARSSEFTQILKQLIDRAQSGSQDGSLGSPEASRDVAAIGWYETTQAWAVTQPTDRYLALNPPSTIILTPPQTITPDLHFSFCFEREIDLPGAFVAQIPQGRIWSAADRSSTAIFTADNLLLGDLSAEFPLLSPGHPDKHPRLHSARSRQLPPLQPIPGTVAVLSGLTDEMYFHWMLDVLPRIDLLQRSGVDLATIDWFLVSDRVPFQQQTLEILEIPTEKVLSVDFPLHVQATELIVPSFPGIPAWMPRWACDFLRRSFLPANLPDGNLRIYISRQTTANRRLINEADVREVLEKFGFQTVILESLTVPEQAVLLAQADVVISPHGSGLTNLVFCRPGTKVIELFAPGYVYPCYWLISCLMELDYYYLTGTTPIGFYLQQLFYPNPRLEDIWIDLDQLQTLLQLIFSKDTVTD